MDIVNKAANNIRILSAAMVEKAKSGHPGGAMGGADFMNILFAEFLEFDPDDPFWNFRDRFFLDPGHMSPLLYSTLFLCEKYTLDDLKSFRQWGSPTPGHPELDVKRGVENTSGPLGQGHTMAVGAAIAERFLAHRFGEWLSHKTYAYISDGGIQEEISQGAGRIAGYLGLSNLIMFYDANEIQLSTEVKDVTIENTAQKYESWGWRVYTINGHDPNQIRNTLKIAVSEKDKPVLIIGNTIMGKGAVDSNGLCFEKNCSTHGQPLSQSGASFERTIENLGGDPEKPFEVFSDVKKYYQEMINSKRLLVKSKRKVQWNWMQRNEELSSKLKDFLAKEKPVIDYPKITQSPNSSTRIASSVILSEFAGKFGNMIIMSADLANSDKTDGFLSKTKAFKYQDFSGAFLHVGVSELTMAALANGMALHGSVIPVCGTFFVFSDYMKPAIRLTALMELPVVFIWTHDSFRVGEDGPTHQPVEHEAQIRLMESLKNHSGNRSMLVLRPSDADETTVAWMMALNNIVSPTALILSRQNIKSLPFEGYKSRYEASLKSISGAYIVKDCLKIPDIILLGNGSEVATLIEVASLLEERKKNNVRVVSVISPSLFLDSSLDYRNAVLIPGVKIFGLTSGLPNSLRDIVPTNGFIQGLDHFGYSAPAECLNEQFGFTPERVFSLIVEKQLI
ncbi:MAG: transketolase [Bacteroidales bacterium]|nr:MAG: transketolase [Bacteroidales bacterium]